METLKQIIDRFGWENMHAGVMPPELKSEARPEDEDSGACVHLWDLYALNGVCVVTQDEKRIVELSAITKTPRDYTRKAQMPMNYALKVENLQKFLEGFKHLHRFSNRYLYVIAENMHFDGIGERMEKAGELYHPERR